jgi:signal transduction histidine kinase/BarA-like signal transduction histidine kinase
MSAARLLIVDDDSALLQALTRALELRMPHLIVDTSDSGVAATRKLEEIDYDAVITDIKMPGMDGLSLLAHVREHSPEIPTLLITGHGQHDLAVQALRGGAFDFIQKPVDRDYLVASLTRALRVRKLDREVQRQRQQLQQHAEELTQTVEQQTRELREANEAKDRFLATLAHELRNPLATIRTAVELLGMCRENLDVRRDAEQAIANQVGHMAHLLDDLLDLSRITHNRIVLHKKTVDLGAIVAETVDSARPSINQRQHRFSLSLPRDPLPVEGDSTRLQQIVDNLLTNAIKYTEPPGTIEVALQRQADQAVLRISDSGIGIASDMLPRVFEPFLQVEDSLAHSQGGLGIGLTLVRKLVELHEGSVTASSDGVGQGSVFTVRLPVCPAPVEEDAEAQPQQEIPALRILLVEDNRSVARMTEKLLTSCGHQVVCIAHDGPTALEESAKHDVDAILLDVGLPGINGYDVARQLRRSPRLSDVLIVAVTGYGNQEDLRRSREAGCNHHLVKPVSVQALQRVFFEHWRSVSSRPA